MHIGCVFVILALALVDRMEASVRYTVGDLGVNINTEGSVIVGKVAKDSIYFDPVDDPYNVRVEVKKLSLFDKDDVLVKEYNFSASSGSFVAESVPIFELDEVPVDGRKMSPTGMLKRDFGEKILHLNGYVFVKDGNTNLGDMPVNVKLYDTKIEMVLGTLEDSEHCQQCKEQVTRFQLDFRFTSSGESRMAVEEGVTKVMKDGGVEILLPNAVVIDGNVQTSEGNPVIETEGEHVDVTLNVPVFNNTAKYQALIIPSEEDVVNTVEEITEEEENEVNKEVDGSEAEYSYSTKPSKSGEEIIVEAGDDGEPAHASGPNGLNEGNHNNGCSFVAGISALVLVMMCGILVGH